MFHLNDVTEVTCTSANVRPEQHGTEKAQAIDLTFVLRKPNDFLNTMEDGLRDHHYYNEAVAKSGQTPGLAPELMPAPDLRFPMMNRDHVYRPNERPRGYTFILDYGLGDDVSNIVLQDAVLAPVHYTTNPDGIVDFTKITVQYNGNQLEDDHILSRLTRLPTKPMVHIRLIAPEKLVLVKGKGWRSGQPDVKDDLTDGGAPLLEEGEQQEGHVGDPGAFRASDDDDVQHAEGSPEAALLASEPGAQEQQQEPSAPAAAKKPARKPVKAPKTNSRPRGRR
jgi:hypothetical protein